MKEIRSQIDAMVERTKTARARALRLTNPCSVAGDQLATDLAELAKDFMRASTALRQAAREVADAEVATRPKWRPPRMNAAKAARQLEKKGARRVTL